MTELDSFTNDGLYWLNTLCDLSDRQVDELSVGHLIRDWENVPVIDRTGYFHNWINAKRIPLPAINHNMNTDIDLYMDLVAQEYTNKYNEIFVLWSGGIDSTALLVSLLKNRKHKDQIKVLISESSVHEYPEFYLKYKEELEWLYLNPDYPAYYYMHALFSRRDNYVILTGTGGDQLFTLVRLNNLGPGIYKERWQDLILNPKSGLLKEPKSCILYSPEQRQTFVNLIEEHMDHTGINCKNVFHGFWYMVFMFSIYKVRGSALGWFRTRTNDYTLNIDNFYLHELIQQWCMYTHIHDLLPNDPNKTPLKNYIFNFNGDKHYRDVKQKWSSPSPLFAGRMRTLFGYKNNSTSWITGPDKLEELYQFLDKDKVKLKNIQDIKIPVTFSIELEGTNGTVGYPNIEILLDNKPVWSGQIIEKQIVNFEHDLSLCQDSFNISIKYPGNDEKKFTFGSDRLPNNATLLHIKLIFITDNDVKQKFIPNIYSLDLSESKFLVQEDLVDEIIEDGVIYQYNSMGYKGIWTLDFSHEYWDEYEKIPDIKDLPNDVADLDFSYNYQPSESIHGSLRPRKETLGNNDPNVAIINSTSENIDNRVADIKKHCRLDY